MNRYFKFKLCKTNTRVVVWSLYLFLAMISLCADTRICEAAPQIVMPEYVTTFDGVSIAVHPDPKTPSITAIITNDGKDTVTIVERVYISESGLLMFDSAGNFLPFTNAEKKRMVLPHPNNEFKLAPGKSLSNFFILSQYYQFNGPGVFYVYVSRMVIGGTWKGDWTSGLQLKYVRSPILQLTLKTGAPPIWKVVPAIPLPNSASQGSQGSQLIIPPYPRHQIPTTGPIATLAQISIAVHTGDLEQIKRLCYQSDSGPEALFVDDAESAIALTIFCNALQKRFGVNPEQHLAQTHSSPETFSRFLNELNLNSLKINGDEASVGILEYQRGKFVPGSFAFYFRKVNGYWLLDSWATYKRIMSIKQYLLEVQYRHKQMQMFNSLTQSLIDNHFANLQEFIIYANQQTTAIVNWFMTQSIKNQQLQKQNHSIPVNASTTQK
jgi:hypothetical protein